MTKQLKPKNNMRKNSEKFKKEARKISIIEGSAYSVMEGFGLKYIVPYALALGATSFSIGILTNLPNLLGNLFQLYTFKIMSMFSRKKILIITTLIQAFAWFMIIGVGILHFIFGVSTLFAVPLLIVVYSMLIIAGKLHVPAWVSWMGDLVTTDRGKYFGMRNMICGIVVIVSMLIAGTVLDLFKDNFNLFIGFVVLFSIAFFSRALTSYLFTKKYEPKFVPEHKYYFSFMEFIKKMQHNNFGRFVIFVSIFYFAASFAGPFFAVYMLNELSYSYVFFTIVIISSSAGYFLLMPLLGRLVDKYGTLKILKLGCLFICLSPFLWLPVIFVFPANSLVLLFCISAIEFLSGIGWAGVSLGTGNFLYEAVTQQRRVICSAYYNILISFGSFFGALLGGFLIYLNISVAWMTVFPLVFLVSGILRIIVYIFFSRNIKEGRICERFNIKKFKMRLTVLKLLNRS